MGRRFFKFRVSRVIPSFQSCRSKDTSSLPPVPPNHVPSFSRLSSSPSKHQRPTLKRHVSSAFQSARRSFLRPRNLSAPSHTEPLSPALFQWQKSPKWHVIAKVTNKDHPSYHHTPPRRKVYTHAMQDDQNDVVMFPPLALKKHRRARKPLSKRRRNFHRVRTSTSSDSGLFTEEEEEEEEEKETDTLFDTDSSSRRRPRPRGAESVPARLSEFMKKMTLPVPCKAVEGKVRESYAVVKKSEEPFEDFKRSMVEMVVEKELFEEKELEEMLRCYLSINDVCHHGVIVRAFVEVWEGLFCPSVPE